MSDNVFCKICCNGILHSLNIFQYQTGFHLAEVPTYCWIKKYCTAHIPNAYDQNCLYL
jgi:hypothetical protein